MGTSLVLAGDVGGTKTLLAVFETRDGKLTPLRRQWIPTEAEFSLTPVVRQFLGDTRVDAACFGVAAPVDSRRERLTNRDFWIDADELQADCRIASVSLLNDFAATGYGLQTLRPDEFVELQAGEVKPQGVLALLGAGTGLGEALLAWCDGAYRVLSSEGGHADFAPVDDAQVALWRDLALKYGHVSYERLLSGQGLVDIHAHVVKSVAMGDALRQVIDTTDPAAAISDHALRGADASAVRALDLFIRIYGQQAGNLALTGLADGGVYVAGGIAPKIIAAMRRGLFVEGFCDKGRYRDYLSRIPIRVVMNADVGLLGAAWFASRQLRP